MWCICRDQLGGLAFRGGYSGMGMLTWDLPGLSAVLVRGGHSPSSRHWRWHVSMPLVDWGDVAVLWGWWVVSGCGCWGG
jgi:hypothetical protein